MAQRLYNSERGVMPQKPRRRRLGELNKETKQFKNSMSTWDKILLDVKIKGLTK